MGKEGDKVVGNGVVVSGGEHLIRMPKLRRLIWYVNDPIYVNITSQGRVLIQIWTEYRTRQDFVTRVSEISDNKLTSLTKNS